MFCMGDNLTRLWFVQITLCNFKQEMVFMVVDNDGDVD